MALEEYDILGILRENTNISYKVQNKLTKAIFTWYAVDCVALQYEDKQNLLRKLYERKSVNHPYLIKFHNHIEHEESGILYISSDYCKKGNLKDIIERCVKNNEYICEEFISRIIYQICFTFKTSRSKIHSIKPEFIFVDDEYKIQIFNFEFCKHSGDTELEMNELVSLIFQLCTLKIDNNNFADFTNFSQYSNEFTIFVKDLLNDTVCPVNSNVDKVLCHPMVLLQASQWTNERCFLPKHVKATEHIAKENLNDINRESIQDMTHKLRKWEHNLKLKESKLKEKEYLLETREKKLNIQEKAVKEKMMKAELYLKRCRDTKSISSGSSRTSNKLKKVAYENLDSTYAEDCGDSITLQTSQKLNVEKLQKPSVFNRTSIDNKKVRFKGHSPLKEVDYNRKRNKSALHKFSLFQDVPEPVIHSNGQFDCHSRKNSQSMGSTTSVRKKNPLSSEIFLVDENMPPLTAIKESNCLPISWTEDSKRQAFELLRVMNNVKDTKHIKHTYL